MGVGERGRQGEAGMGGRQGAGTGMRQIGGGRLEEARKGGIGGKQEEAGGSM